MRRLYLAFALTLVPCTSQAQAGAGLRNWYDDPFFQISSAVPDCPIPAGPYVTKAARDAQAHFRAEKGTTCWLSGECDRPNAFAYDRDIATAFQETVRKENLFRDTSLWVTVQARVVYVEGCATAAQGREVEEFARSLPYVDQVFVNIDADRTGSPPYRLKPGN